MIKSASKYHWYMCMTQTFVSVMKCRADILQSFFQPFFVCNRDWSTLIWWKYNIIWYHAIYSTIYISKTLHHHTLCILTNRFFTKIISVLLITSFGDTVISFYTFFFFRELSDNKGSFANKGASEITFHGICVDQSLFYFYISVCTNTCLLVCLSFSTLTFSVYFRLWFFVVFGPITALIIAIELIHHIEKSMKIHSTSHNWIKISVTITNVA